MTCCEILLSLITYRYVTYSFPVCRVLIVFTVVHDPGQILAPESCLRANVEAERGVYNACGSVCVCVCVCVCECVCVCDVYVYAFV